MLFSVHPIHVEAVSGIVGRADILACTTFFSAFVFYNKSTKSCDSMITYLYLGMAILLAGISMLFKENGVTVLVSNYTYCYCQIVSVSKGYFVYMLMVYLRSHDLYEYFEHITLV